MLAVGQCGAEVVFLDFTTREPIGEPLTDLVNDLDASDLVVGLRFFMRNGRQLLLAGAAFPIRMAVWDVTTLPPVLIGREDRVNAGLAGGWLGPDGLYAMTRQGGPIELMDPLSFGEDGRTFEHLQ